MASIPTIKGAKGGGGSGGSVTNTPDNLRSKDTVEVILGICEGPIFGLQNGAKSFYIGDTQLQNESGEFNFAAFKLAVFPGTDADDPIVPVLGGTSSSFNVNLLLASGTAVTRQTQTVGIDFIDIRLAFSRLLNSDDNGTNNASVTIRIEFKAHSDVTWTKAFGQDLVISGKTTSTYVKELRLAVPKLTDDTFDIRVTKISVDDTTTYFADVAWESYQETVAGNASYPNTACVQLVGESSDQFSSIPQWRGIYKGMIIKVPSNYDPLTRIYTGIWDGTFQMAWTDNPAWILYDLTMNDRYGIKNYYPTINIDKFDTYEAGQWCDELVPDGKGGMQPRYTFNAYITDPRSGKELARYIAGAFNGTFFDDLNGTAYLRVDKDDDACNIFTRENIYDDGFEYTYTDITTRYNDITVTFNNPDLDWAEDRRRVFDQDLIDRNGRIPLDFVAVGCINDHEAIRRAYYKLITSNTETCMVTFRTNRLGQFVNPFDVIMICDPDMGYGISGRVKTIDDTGTIIGLRDPIYLEAGIEYDIQFVLSDGTIHRTSITGATKGYNSTLTIEAALPDDNTPERTVFTLENDQLIGLPRPFRVTSVEEQDGSPDNYTITAININRNKWYDADNIIDTGTINYSVLPSPFNPPGPTACAFEERYMKDLKEFHITVSPVFDRGAYKYYANDHSFEVWSRKNGTTDPYVKREVYFGDTLINHPDGGLYDFKVLGKSYLGKTTDIDTAPVYEFQVVAPKDPPKDIDYAKINKSEVYWGYTNPPDDFAGFVIRYQNQAGRTTWTDAIPAHEGILSATSFYTNLIPPSAQVILIRAVDDFGVTSVNSAIILRDPVTLFADNAVDETDFHPTFAGTKVGCTVDGTDLKADDTGALVYSGSGDALMYDGGDFYEATYLEMDYIDQFTTTVQGDCIFALDFEGSGYEINIRVHTIDDSNPWEPVPERVTLDAGTYDVKLRIFGGTTRGIIHTFSAISDPPDISEDIQDITVDATGLVRPTLTKTYNTIKIVSVIIQDDGVNHPMSYRIMDKTNTGPQIKLLDGSGTVTAGLIDVQIKGY